ncbi:hypothetical protein [Methylobacterium brachiatum]
MHPAPLRAVIARFAARFRTPEGEAARIRLGPARAPGDAGSQSKGGQKAPPGSRTTSFQPPSDQSWMPVTRMRFYMKLYPDWRSDKFFRYGDHYYRMLKIKLDHKILDMS